MAPSTARKPGIRVSRDYVAENPGADPTATELVINAIAVGQWLSHRLDEILRPHGITSGSFAVLQIVAGDPEPVTPSQIVSRAIVPVTSATVTGLLDTLERRGLVERQRHPTDRRKVMVILTDDGRALLDAVNPLVVEGEKRWTAALTKAERRTTTDALGKLGEHLLAADATSSA
jgi:DNA-binding MarR family transcriptional regulator